MPDYKKQGDTKGKRRRTMHLWRPRKVWRVNQVMESKTSGTKKESSTWKLRTRRKSQPWTKKNSGRSSTRSTPSRNCVRQLRNESKKDSWTSYLKKQKESRPRSWKKDQRQHLDQHPSLLQRRHLRRKRALEMKLEATTGCQVQVKSRKGVGKRQEDTKWYIRPHGA